MPLRFSKIAIFFLLFLSIDLFAQINPDNIDIIRDEWGVPHIFAATDIEVAYGLGWASAEDNFEIMQESLLAVRSQLGAVTGKEGAIFDVIAHLIGVEDIVKEQYDTAFSPEYKQIISAYVQAVNDFAQKNPKRLLNKKLLPITEHDIVGGYVLGLSFITNVHFDIKRIFDGSIADVPLSVPSGSNAFAISPSKTQEGESFLAINSHQPLEGPYSWYEVHLHSDEGLNISGATFPGGMSIFHGANEHLGWAHTVNVPDLCDVYQLEMHPSKKLSYRFDGEWYDLEKRKLKFKVKLAPGIKLPLSKTTYWSKHGPVIKNKAGFYALRFPANMDIAASEQWHEMNKATNFDEFYEALKMQELAGMNIVYADTENIFYISNGQFPLRNPAYDFTKVLPGDTSATLWEAQKYHPIESLPQLLNPQCGYVMNTNNTPFNATCAEENVDPKSIDPSMGFLEKDNNRSLRFHHLIEQQDLLSYQQFKDIKYDSKWMKPAYTYTVENLESIFNLDGSKYPSISESIQTIKDWNRDTNADNKNATIFSLTVTYYMEKLYKENRLNQINQITEQEAVEVLTKAQKHLKKHFGSIFVPLGELQKHVRGDKQIGIWGTPDVLASMHTIPHKKGRFKSFIGESFIQLVRFSKEEGVMIESVNCFGASNNEDSEHYDDQMQMYVNQDLKKMSLNKEEIYKNAKEIYHPK